VLVSESDDDDADSDADVLRDVDFLDHLSSAGERPSKPLDCSDLLSSDPLTRRADPYSRRNNHKVGTIGVVPMSEQHRISSAWGDGEAHEDAGSACAFHRPAARSVWPRTNDLGARDLSARSGADRVYDAGADRQIWAVIT
jgi:hypothetical protein